MRRGVLAHSGSAQGEVIEWHTGRRSMVNRTAIEWFHSTSHRHVMLARHFHRAGAGKAVGRINGRRCTIWVVQFGH